MAAPLFTITEESSGWPPAQCPIPSPLPKGRGSGNTAVELRPGGCSNCDHAHPALNLNRNRWRNLGIKIKSKITITRERSLLNSMAVECGGEGEELGHRSAFLARA